MQDWPHQIRGVDGVEAALAAGHRRVCLTSPTGGGKTRIMCRLIERWIDQGHEVAIYTNRRMLVGQIGDFLDRHRIDHGKRAAGWDNVEGKFFPVQICSVQTEDARVHKRQKWALHDAQRVLIDEAHLIKSGVARKIMHAHLQRGAHIVGVTATPLDIGDLYDHLIAAGTTSELRECGALLTALHYGPDEPDLRHIGRVAAGKDLTEQQNVSAIMRNGIFGRVLEWLKRLNPEMRPTILFAPGVQESIWFTDRFNEAGINAAHIDGEHVYVNGNVQRSTRMARDDVLEASKEGRIKVLCNRFVLRERIDAPWLQHGILATVFGSLQSYLQSCGRLLRAHPGMDHVVIQDHGGNWWRHGSVNDDREWSLEFTSAMVSGLREERLRVKKLAEPFRCPECGMILKSLRCRCGYMVDPKKRPPREVVQADGALKQMRGDIVQPRRAYQRPDGSELWKKMYYRSRSEKGHRTFLAAMALFARENNWGWPERTWPLMPKLDIDLFRYVSDVPRERLH